MHDIGKAIVIAALVAATVVCAVTELRVFAGFFASMFVLTWLFWLFLRF